jgi:alpha-tubulin suppressor-like RCC1 family protein
MSPPACPAWWQSRPDPSNSYALKADGTVVGWGDAYTNVVPANVSGLAALAAGSQHAFAINTDGTVTAWGRILNNSGSDSERRRHVRAESAEWCWEFQLLV